MKRAWMAALSLLGTIGVSVALSGSAPMRPAWAQLPPAPQAVPGSLMLPECTCAKPTRLADGSAVAVNCQCGPFQCVFGVAEGGKSPHPPSLVCFR